MVLGPLSVRCLLFAALFVNFWGASVTPDADAPQSDDGAAQPVYRICRVTAYCDQGVTASGAYTAVGQCAAPGDIPFGSLVYVPELDRTFVVTDRTARRFRRNTVDIFMPSRDACLEFGRKYLECRFTIGQADTDSS